MSYFSPSLDLPFQTPPGVVEDRRECGEKCSKLFQPCSNPLQRAVCSNPLIPPGSEGTPTPPACAVGVRGPTQPIKLASLAATGGGRLGGTHEH